MISSPRFAPALLARIEDASINASAPREQRWLDGWLVRLSPGKAKRARSIQAVATGRLGIDDKLALCLPCYAQAGLRPFVRITPFSEPNGLDRRLEEIGMVSMDDTRVMVLPSLDTVADATETDDAETSFAPATAADFAEWVGRARGSTPGERLAHADRIGHPAVPHHGVLARDATEEVVAAGQLVIEGEIAGIYDIFSALPARGRGHAQRLCQHLLSLASSRGARVAYLQVDAGNDAARHIYRRLGFVDAYAYHYRTPAEGDA